jgi:hypothetical protein
VTGPRASEYSVEAAPDPCVRQDLGGWTAVFRVGREAQRIAKVEILPGDGLRRGQPGPSVAETLSAYGIDNLEDAYQLGASMAYAERDRLPAPEVELTGRMVRAIKPATALRKYVDAMHGFLTGGKGRPFLEVMLGPGWKEALDRLEHATPASTSEARRRALVTTAARYVDACEHRDPSPVRSVSVELGLTRGQVRDRLHAAREAELLTKIGQGARGGALSAAAIAILNAGTEP